MRASLAKLASANARHLAPLIIALNFASPIEAWITQMFAEPTRINERIGSRHKIERLAVCLIDRVIAVAAALMRCMGALTGLDLN